MAKPKIDYRGEVTTQGNILVIYKDGEPVGNLRQIGKGDHPDVELRSSYIKTPIRAPMTSLAAVEMRDVERIFHKYIEPGMKKESPKPAKGAKVEGITYYRGVSRHAGMEAPTGERRRPSVYLTRSEREAKFYGKDIEKVTVKPKNPMYSETAVDAAKKLGVLADYDKYIGSDPIKADEVIYNAAKKAGYDVIIRRDGDWVQVIDKGIISPVASAKPAKEPWQMRVNDYIDYREHNPMFPGVFETKDIHKGIVQDALKEGKPVPAEVLKDYPELGKREEPKFPYADLDKGDRAKIVHRYGDVPVGREGTVIKAWTNPKTGNKWARLDFGANLSGQRLRNSYPTNVLEKAKPEAPAKPAKEEKGVATARYHKGSVGDTVRAAKKLKSGVNLYVYPTGEGMKIAKQPPPFGLQYIIVKPDGSHKTVSVASSFEGGRREEAIMPKAALGAPETGLQADIEGKTTPVTPKGKGKAVTAGMDAFAKLQKARQEYQKEKPAIPEGLGTLSHEDAQELIAGLDLRTEKLEEGIDEGKANLESIKESLDPKVAKLTEIIPTTKEGKSEITHITKGKYKKVWGKEPPASIVSKGKVRWEYALDTIAQELHLEDKAQTEGKAPDEYLKGLIEDAKDTKELIRATEGEIRSDESTLKALDKLKDTIKARTSKVTTGPLLQKIAKPLKVKPLVKPKPATRAKAILAGVAQELIRRTQAKRSPRAIIIDNALLAKGVVPMSKVETWAKNPNRLDIRGVDTPGRGRIVAGVAYADKGKKRLSRKHHRGFKRIKFA